MRNLDSDNPLLNWNSEFDSVPEVNFENILDEIENAEEFLQNATTE